MNKVELSVTFLTDHYIYPGLLNTGLTVNLQAKKMKLKLKLILDPKAADEPLNNYVADLTSTMFAVYFSPTSRHSVQS